MEGEILYRNIPHRAGSEDVASWKMCGPKSLRVSDKNSPHTPLHTSRESDRTSKQNGQDYDCAIRRAGPEKLGRKMAGDCASSEQGHIGIHRRFLPNMIRKPYALDDAIRRPQKHIIQT